MNINAGKSLPSNEKYNYFLSSIIFLIFFVPRQFELEKIVMIGGQLDSTVLEEEKLRPVTLQVAQ